MASSRRRKWKNKPDSFCYVCGCYTLLRQRRNITSFVKRAYKAYFQISLGDQDKKCSSHIVCHNCEKTLRDWTNGKQKELRFGVPMIWREPRNHVTNCYFCMVNTKDVGKKNQHKISYPSIPLAIRPAPHLKNFRSRFLVVFPQVQTVMMISESMRAAITRWFLNLNLFQMTPIGYQLQSYLGKRN